MLKKVVDKYCELMLEEVKKTKCKELKNAYETVVSAVHDEEEQKVIMNTSFGMLATFTATDEFVDEGYEHILAEFLEKANGELIQARNKYVFRIKMKGLTSKISREIAIPSNYTLCDFGIAIILAFNGDGGHLFDFRIDRQRYSLDAGSEYFNMEDLSLFEVRLKDLNLTKQTKINFCYDFGDNYEFIVQFVKEIEEMGEYPIEVLKGKGYGIWEDNHYLLDMYYINPNMSLEDYIGEDVSLREYIPFDPEECDLEELNDTVNSMLHFLKDHYENEVVNNL